MLVLAVQLKMSFLHVHCYQASQAWMEWLIKKRKAFDQRGDMAIAAWAEQQQRELNLRARRLSRSKVLNKFFFFVISEKGCFVILKYEPVH